MADNRIKTPNPSAALLASAASILANAASDDKSKGGRVFLNNHLDWDDWYREFQTKARLLWPYITRVRPWPVNTVAEPNALHFYNGDADEDGFDQADPQAALQLLDPQERSLFDSAWKVYSDKLRMQDTHDDRVNALKDWVLASVSPPAKYGCCNPDQDLSAWHDQLQATYGFGVLESKLKISDDYGNALTPLQGNQSHDLPWLTNWETVISLAQARQIAVTTDRDIWFHDLIKCARPAYPSWASGYEAVHKTNRGLRPSEVATALRAYIMIGPLGPKTYKGNANTSSFGTLGGSRSGRGKGSERGKGGNNSGKKPGGKTRDDRGGRQGYKRSRDEEDDSGRVSCPLCEKTGHVVEDCWYQYPEKAPASFKPTKSTQGLVAANLKADPSLGGGSKKVKQS